MGHIEWGVSGGVAEVRLNRPEKLNALSLEMLSDLAATARALRREPDVRAVILSGEGRSFCAGLDLKSTAKDPAGIAWAFVPTWRGTNLFQEACWAWRRLPVPVIAAVHGHVFGGGLQIALGADLRVTTPDARWCVMEVARGLIPDMSGIQLLSELTGIETAKRLILTADEFSGTEAVRLGIAGIAAGTGGAGSADVAAGRAETAGASSNVTSSNDAAPLEPSPNGTSPGYAAPLDVAHVGTTPTDASRRGTISEPAAAPLDEARALAARIAERRPEAVRAGKRLVNRTWTRGPLRTFAAERTAQLRLLPGALKRR